MAEALLPCDAESRVGSEDDRSVRLSEFPSSITSVENEAVMAPRTKSLDVSQGLQNIVKKACLEDQIEERMRASIESRFSSFEEKMLGLMADFLRQQRSANACLTTTSVTNNVCAALSSTSGACQLTRTRINTYGADKGRSNVISLDNS